MSFKYTIADTLSHQILRILGFLCFCLLLSNVVYSQKPNYSPLVCTVLNYDFMTKEGEVVTNVLSVKNQNGIAREFYLEIGCPSDWKVLTSSKRVYNIEPDDSIFIPIRLLPNLQTMKGSTKYNVSVFVVGTDGRTHAVCSFQVGKPKRVDWDMKVLPRSRIYFLNDQYDASLGVNITNKGEEPQDVNLSWKILGQGLTLLGDSIKKRNFLDLLIEPDSEVELQFNVSLLRPIRNLQRVDIESYIPTSINDPKKYTIYFRGSEPKVLKKSGSKTVQANLIKLNSSVDFIKLSNSYTVNSYGSSVIPLTWYSNIYNILGIQPIWMNNARIDMPLPNNAFLRGTLQHLFTFYTPTSNTLRSLNGLLNYNSEKLNINFGGSPRLMIPMVGGVMNNIRSRSGISANYKPNKNFSFAASLGVTPSPFDPPLDERSLAFGTNYSTNKEGFQVGAGYGRSSIISSSTRVNNFSGGVQFRFFRIHSFSTRVSYNLVNQNIGLPNNSSVDNWNLLLSYSGRYFNNKLQQAIIFQRLELFNTGSSILNNILNLQSRTSYSFGKSNSLNFNISYVENNLQSNTSLFQSRIIPATLSLKFKRLSSLIPLPSLFYTYSTNNLPSNLHFRGVILNSSFNDQETRFRLGFTFLGGYSLYSDSLKFTELFTANTGVVFGFRTLTGSVRYSYGPMGMNAVRSFHYNGLRYPQYIFSNLNYQFVFRNPRFVTELLLNHSWNNQTYSNNVSFGPQVFYFTKNRWRFEMRFLYSVNSRNNERALEFYEYQGFSSAVEPEDRITFASNFNLSFGIKKEFGIPVPKKWRKLEYVDAHFTAFLDFNGNKIMDNDEVPLENIVIKVNGHEILTDKEGKGKFVNIPVGTYEHKIIPLVDLDGWFTYTMDSIDIIGEQYYVPFTRGVKVSGSVVLDREKFTKDVLATLDLSGIKIFTTDTLGNTMATMTDFNGNFSFYVPYGAYILSMDEEVIGDRFYIAQNHIPMDLYDGMDGFYQSFFIIEKRRTVKKKKFNEKGELIMVEEVDGGADRNTNNSTVNNYSDSTVIHNNNNTYNIFNEERKGNDGNGGGSNINADELYEELDERIDRLDAIIRALLKGEITDDNRKVLAEALRQLKNEEEAKRLNGSQPQPEEGTIDLARHFHLVVGGFVYRENAEKYVAKLKAQGLNEAVIIGVFNGYFLVRLKDYSTLEEAIEGQQKYKYVDKGLWVHKWP